MFDGKKLEDSVFVANSLLDFSNYRVKEKRMKSYFAERALSIFFGTLGFFSSKSFCK